jgi:hypothetical protein
LIETERLSKANEVIRLEPVCSFARRATSDYPIVTEDGNKVDPVLRPRTGDIRIKARSAAISPKPVPRKHLVHEQWPRSARRLENRHSKESIESCTTPTAKGVDEKKIAERWCSVEAQSEEDEERTP